MLKKLFKYLGIFQCKHKDKILVGHSYATYTTCGDYSVSSSTETYRHFVCKKCNIHIKEVMTKYAPNKDKENVEQFEERLRSKGFLRTEDIMIEVDKAIYGEIESMKSLDKNKTR